ncbi:hypothetical protein SLS62_002575 [Diatrype stigma]|uniref:Uncharacterized protein n=1 Tax=Diatrype stigma TaxID=117547 RepID=A0AAN9UTR1_9PEZI
MGRITGPVFEKCMHEGSDVSGDDEIQGPDGVLRSELQPEPMPSSTGDDHDDAGRHDHRYEPRITKEGYCGKCQMLINRFAGELGAIDVGTPSIVVDKEFWEELGFLPTDEATRINMVSINWHLKAEFREAGPAHRGDTFIVHRILQVQLIKACVKRLLLRKAIQEKQQVESPWTALRKTLGLPPVLRQLLELLLSSLGQGRFNQFNDCDFDWILCKAFDNLKERIWCMLNKTDAEILAILQVDLDRQIQRAENGILAWERRANLAA